YYQYQVILKPDPGNPQELYLSSLRALGLDPSRHDVRFVEDNWQTPALGAWGLGWEVWLDGQEISQFTYFQQAGGFDVDPVAVEITYGLERIVMALQDVPVFQDIVWTDQVTYGDVLFRGEVEQCRYNFEVASVPRLRELFDLYEAEARDALAAGLALPAYDHALQCSHTFNVLDARGAVGVTERAHFFGRLRDLSRAVAETYLAGREELGYPLLQRAFGGAGLQPAQEPAPAPVPAVPRTFVLEVGCEELPAGDLTTAIEYLREAVTEHLAALRLEHGAVTVEGTPRRLAVLVDGVAPVQPDEERVIKGPPAKVAFDAEGRPTKAALGFARSNDVPVERLEVRAYEGREYVAAVQVEHGLPASQVLGPMVVELLNHMRFGMSMRWNESGVNFSRPIRWLVALLGEAVVPLVYAGVASSRVSRGIRPEGTPEFAVASAEAYAETVRTHHIMLSVDERRAAILEQGRRLAAEAGGEMVESAELLAETANMVEWPVVVRGGFADEYLHLPEPVLITVMREHQRYFPLVSDGRLLPAFLTVANGPELAWDVVRHGNEEVLRARFADAAYFYRSDREQALADLVPQLATLTFQADLGSMLDKVRRLERLVPVIARLAGLGAEEMVTVERAAFLSKADLATKMVVEHTSLQGVMGEHYALRSGELEDVARAIAEQYLPRFVGDALPVTRPGMVLGLADRLDSLVGLFAVGLAPTGSSDPYALRRAALGVVQLLVGGGLSFSLREAVEAAAGVQPLAATSEVQADVLAFIQQRLRGLLLDQAYRYDVVDAVLAERGEEPLRATRAVEALQAAVQQADWGSVLVAYARTLRITRDLTALHELDPRRFTEPAERELNTAYAVAVEQVAERREVDALVDALRGLVGPITRFFDAVLVMAEDPAVRANRLALLQRIAALPKGIADLSRLEGF
ncbi:MAG TPA: glycine--tRNA ligase subunit beta, partial [Anaerolineae bacterium]|nr:glycine--tRNA ligase subunit beta [Anaerolineae bacterium]